MLIHILFHEGIFSIRGFFPSGDFFLQGIFYTRGFFPRGLFLSIFFPPGDFFQGILS